MSEVKCNRSPLGRRIGVAAVLMAAIGLEAGGAMAAEPSTLTIDAGHPGVAISPSLYGLMTEEINHSYDGGLYGELIQNRIFKDVVLAPRGRRRPPEIPPMTIEEQAPPEQPLHWSVVQYGGGAATIQVDTANPVNTVALKYSLRMDIQAPGAAKADETEIRRIGAQTPAPAEGIARGPATVGISNDGYWGIPVKPATEYKVSFYARASAEFTGALTVDIENAETHAVQATGTVPAIGKEWKQYALTIKTGNVPASSNNIFVLSTSGTQKGSIWFNLVSCFPPTYHDRPNGNRKDMMELLAGMDPAFLRFPGGNYVQGDYFNERFNWKETVGPLEQRPGHMSPWYYRSSDGMGLLEFMNWCEDLKMEPVLAVFDGFALRRQGLAQGPELEPYVTEAMEELEYITGGPETKWGAVRAKDGHPAPFKIRFVEVGNEDAFDPVAGRYDGRFTQFYDAIKKKYPEMQVISTMAKVTSRKPDIVDDHFYRTPQQMAGDAHHYDKYDRQGPKIMVGEYASREGANRTVTPPLRASLGDAAWLTGLERNSDVVILSCYAPMFTNVNPRANQWPVDMIGFDGNGCYGSPTYFVTKMFAENRGDVVLPAVMHEAAGPAAAPTPPPATAPAAARGAGGGDAAAGPAETLFAEASRDQKTGDVILKFVNTTTSPRQVAIQVDGVSQIAGGTLEVLTGDPAETNSVAEPTKVSPKQVPLEGASASFTHEFPGSSVSVMRLHAK